MLVEAVFIIILISMTGAFLIQKYQSAVYVESKDDTYIKQWAVGELDELDEMVKENSYPENIDLLIVAALRKAMECSHFNAASSILSVFLKNLNGSTKHDILVEIFKYAQNYSSRAIINQLKTVLINESREFSEEIHIEFICLAYSSGDEDLIIHLVDNFQNKVKLIEPFIYDFQGSKTPFQMAIEKKYINVLNSLIKVWEIKNSLGLKELHSLIKIEAIALIDILLEIDAIKDIAHESYQGSFITQLILRVKNPQIIIRLLKLDNIRTEVKDKIPNIIREECRNGAPWKAFMCLDHRPIRDLVGNSLEREVSSYIENLSPSQAFRSLTSSFLKDYLKTDAKRCLRFFSHKLFSCPELNSFLFFGATFRPLWSDMGHCCWLPEEVWLIIVSQVYALELSGFDKKKELVSSLAFARTPKDIRKVLGCEVEVPDFQLKELGAS